MKIAFYAPMKSPRHPNPSGDRRMARLLMRALEQAGHEVVLISEFRSFCKQGMGEDRQSLHDQADRERRRLREEAEKPDLWFTYHLHYKAPDHLGPDLTRYWNIPYVVAEASHAPKRAQGEWADNHALVEQALQQADRVLYVTRADHECLSLLLGDEKLAHLPPFLDEAEFRGAGGAGLREGFGLPDCPVLLSVGMMRPGDKMESYRILAKTLTIVKEKNPDLDWLQWIVGDGAGREEAEELFAPLGSERVRFEGLMPEWALPAIYGASDIYIWPAIREAYGLAFMEAQGCGLPVVAGDALGVPDVVAHGTTGLLSPEGRPDMLADNLIDLLINREKRLSLGAGARDYIGQSHSLSAAAERLKGILREFEE